MCHLRDLASILIWSSGRKCLYYGSTRASKAPFTTQIDRMKMMKKKVIYALCLLFISVLCFAQSNEVKLVVSSDGPTKEEATKNALRSAIEQAYGTFVSANTEILNDELVKDEIVSISSGNIKSYKELSSERLNGLYSVTLEAVVSIGKLISFAQSHGANAEFAGQTFAMNMRIRELNKKNEAIALDHLVRTLENYKTLFNFSISIEEPKELLSSQWTPKPGCPFFEYTMIVNITTSANDNYRLFVKTLKNTLSALSLPLAEREAYEKNGTPFTVLAMPVFGDYEEEVFTINATEYYCLRNDLNVIRDFSESILVLLGKEMGAFTLLQNEEKGVTSYSLSSKVKAEPVVSRKIESSIISRRERGQGPNLSMLDLFFFPELSSHKNLNRDEYSPYCTIKDTYSPAIVSLTTKTYGGGIIANAIDGYHNVSLYRRYTVSDKKLRDVNGVIVHSLNNDNITPYIKDEKKYELFLTTQDISRIKGFEIKPLNDASSSISYNYEPENSSTSNAGVKNLNVNNALGDTHNLFPYDDVAKKPTAKGYKSGKELEVIKVGVASYCFGGSESLHIDFIVDKTGATSSINYGAGVPERAKDSIARLVNWFTWTPGQDAQGNFVSVRIGVDCQPEEISGKQIKDYLDFAKKAKLPDRL